MKYTTFGMVTIAAMTLFACDSKVQSGDTSASSSDITTDKMQMANAMRQSNSRGTFSEALEIAMQDSSLAEKVAQDVMADPRFKGRFAAPEHAGVVDPKTPEHNSAVHSAGAVHSTTTAAQPKKDPLDKAEETAAQANAKLEQANRIKQQAEEAKKKVDQILKP